MKQPKGWISLHRTIEDHWLYPKNRKFTKYEAWIDILLETNHSEQKVLIKGILLTCKRGESIRSMKEWAKRWNWSKSNVKRFFDLLKSDSMIDYKNVQITTHLTVCNYDSYQDSRNATETQMERKRNANGTQVDTNNNVNNSNNSNNGNKILLFDSFWDAYDKKIDRKKCEAKWNRLPVKDKEAILEFIPIYQAHQPDEKYRKNPYTFLNSEIWAEDWNNYQPKSENNDSSNDFYQQLSELEQINEVQRHNDQEGASPVNIYQLRGR